MCDGPSTRLEARLFAILVTFLTVFTSSTTLYDLYIDPLVRLRVPPHLQVSSWTQTCHAVLFAWCIALALASYFACYSTKPGGAEDWAMERPDLIEMDGEWGAWKGDEEVGTGVPMCKFCDKPKPERVHHCRTCGRCVLRMDHHCPWVGNCIGYKNHKYFVLYLFYTTLSTFYASILLVRFLVHCQITPLPLSGRALVLAGIFTPFAIMIAAGSLVSVGSLLIWSLFLLVKNQTSVEYHKFNTEDGSFTYVPRSYSKGIVANVRHVMGNNGWLWLLPFRQPRRRQRKQRQ